MIATTTGNWTWLAEDLSNAFDNVPHDRLIDVLRRQIPTDDFLALIRNVIANDKKRGLRQGGALSPLFLNTYLDHVLDKPWKKSHAETPLLRVADDILILCKDREQAVVCKKALEDMLRSAGMPLNGEKGGLSDLGAGQSIDWLGYDLRRDVNGLEARLTEKSWSRLKEVLKGTHDKPNAPIRANETIVGWIEQLGPCLPYSDVDAVLARIRRTGATSLLSEGVPSNGELRLQW